MRIKTFVSTSVLTAIALAGQASVAGAQQPADRELLQFVMPTPSTEFGRVVALDGNQAAVTDRFEQRRVHILAWDGYGWTVKQSISFAKMLTVAGYGESLLLRGDRMYVGDPTYNYGGMFVGKGKVFQYLRVGGSFVLTGMQGTYDDLDFGAAMCFVGEDMVAYGARSGFTYTGGVVRLYKFSGQFHYPDQVLAPADLPAGAGFGGSLAFASGHLCVGAPMDTPPGGSPGQGSVRVFQQESGVWVQKQVLTTADGETFTNFGASIAADGEWLAVCADGKLGPPVAQGGWGAVHLFRLVDGAYVEVQVIGAPAPAPGVKEFAHALALQGDNLFVGAPYSDVPLWHGAGRVFHYRLDAGSWIAAGELVSSEPGGGEHLGMAVAAQAVDDEDLAQPCGLMAGLPGRFAEQEPGSVEFYALGTPGFAALGHGLGGVRGDPVLLAHGAPQAGASFELRLGSAAPLAPVLLFAGSTELDLQHMSGVLVPYPTLVYAGWVTDWLGHVLQPLTWPGDAADLAVITQAWVADAAAPSGWSASNGVQLTVAP